MFEKLKDFSSNRFLRKTVLLVIRTCKVYNFAWGQIAGVAGGCECEQSFGRGAAEPRGEIGGIFLDLTEALAASPRKLSHAQNNSASYSG